jgi:hypothetical protein
MDKKFYYCTVTVQAPSGATTNFITYAIAETASEASEIAKQTTAQTFPPGWTVTHTLAIAFQRDLLERVAEEVLGWPRP